MRSTEETIDRLKNINWAGVTLVFNRRFDQCLDAMRERDPNLRRSRIESLTPMLDWQSRNNPLLRAIESADDVETLPTLIGETYYSMTIANRPQAYLRDQSQLQVIKTALAASIYRAQNGEDPKDASQLGDLLVRPALDPLDGNPIRMLRRDGKLIVYSVGENLADQTREAPSEDVHNDDFTVHLTSSP